MKRILVLAVAVVCLSVGSRYVSASVVTGEIFYTLFSGTPNVKKVSVDYDGGSLFTLGTKTSIGTTPGADGISGNPQNSDLLIVGGQGGDISTISKTTGTVTTVSSPTAAFHLEVSDPVTVYSTGIPGAMSRHPILGNGDLGPGTAITISGPDTDITQLISTPSGFFYTSSGSGGSGTYGTLTFTGATTATTSRLYGSGGSVSGSTLPAAHGGVYDPFTNNVILVGDDYITQLDLAGNIISDRNLSGFGGVNPNFDQGTVDGKGHLFAASNSGNLLFVDYAASGLVGDLGNFTALPFLDSFLDDIAPLVGPGATPVIPEPASLLVWCLLASCAGVVMGCQQEWHPSRVIGGFLKRRTRDG